MSTTDVSLTDATTTDASTLASSTTSTTDAASEIASAAVETATAPVETATAPVETATAPETVDATVEVVSETATAAAEPVTQAVDTTVDAVTDTAAAAVEPVTEAVPSATHTVTQATTDATQAVDNTVAVATENTATATQQVTQSADATVASVTATTTTATQQVTKSVGANVATVTGTAPPNAGKNEGEVVQTGLGTDISAPGTVPIAQPTGPVGSVPPVATDPVQAVVSPVEQQPMTTGQVEEVLPQEVLLTPDGALTPTEPAASLADVLTGMEVTEILPIAGAVGLAAIGATAIVRGAFQPSASILFTNFRLAPCLVSASVQQSAAAATSVVSRREGIGTVEKGFGAGAGFGSIRDGFVGRPPVAKAGGGLMDSKLLIQIGMLLGLVYLGILTVWFWATRLPWKSGS